MAWQGRSRSSWQTWAYPAAGLTAALGLSCVPGLPFGVGRWPAGGVFGVFTWSAWFVSTTLAVTLGLLAGVLRLRRVVPVRLAGLRRVFLAALGFAVLAVLAYVAASRVDLMKRHPLAALGLAMAALAALRGLSLAATRPPDDIGPGTDTDPSRSESRRRSSRDDDRDDDTEEDEPGVPRWASLLATVTAGLLVLVVVAAIALRWLGPGLGLMFTTQHDTPIFWSETAFFEYDTVKRTRADASAFLRPPEPGSDEVARRGVLPGGVKLAIKGWVENGIQVRVEHDPVAKLEGEWGFVRVSDLGE